MKNTNAVYKPVEPSNLDNGRVFIFWSNCEDEITVKTRPGSTGLWSPNHFVPLVERIVVIEQQAPNESM